MNLPITPETKIGVLLETYPAIEEKLISWVPAFSKLKNPVLRKTVAKVATVEQAARIGGIGIRELILKLRDATGQNGLLILSEAAAPAGSGPAPDWVDENRVLYHVDADTMLETGEHPIGKIRAHAKELMSGELIRLTSSFRPAPLIETLSRSGLAVYSVEATPGQHVTYIGK